MPSAGGWSDTRRSARADHLVGAEALRQRVLVRVLGGGDDGPERVLASQGGDGQQAERARADDGDALVGAGGRDLAGGVDGTGEGLDHHGRFVAQVLGDRQQLAGVGHHLGGPAAAG